MNKTKIIGFTYTKENGEVSNRVGITLGYSTPQLALVADVSDLNDDKFIKELRIDLETARRNYLDHVAAILRGYGVNQKTFKLSGMTDEKEILL